jgi:hypothetical protein
MIKELTRFGWRYKWMNRLIITVAGTTIWAKAEETFYKGRWGANRTKLI